MCLSPIPIICFATLIIFFISSWISCFYLELYLSALRKISCSISFIVDGMFYNFPLFLPCKCLYLSFLNIFLIWNYFLTTLNCLCCISFVQDYLKFVPSKIICVLPLASIIIFLCNFLNNYVTNVLRYVFMHFQLSLRLIASWLYRLVSSHQHT